MSVLDSRARSILRSADSEPRRGTRLYKQKHRHQKSCTLWLEATLHTMQELQMWIHADQYMKQTVRAYSCRQKSVYKTEAC